MVKTDGWNKNLCPILYTEVCDTVNLKIVIAFLIAHFLICLNLAEIHQSCSSSRWLEKDSQISNFASSDDESVSKSDREKGSPRTVLEACERESQSTEDDASSFDESINTKSPVAPELKGQVSSKPMSPLKRFSSFLFSSFDLNARKRNDVFYNKEKYQPGFKCFNYEQIANATKHFHQG